MVRALHSFERLTWLSRVWVPRRLSYSAPCRPPRATEWRSEPRNSIRGGLILRREWKRSIATIGGVVTSEDTLVAADVRSRLSELGAATYVISEPPGCVLSDAVSRARCVVKSPHGPQHGAAARVRSSDPMPWRGRLGLPVGTPLRGVRSSPSEGTKQGISPTFPSRTNSWVGGSTLTAKRCVTEQASVGEDRRARSATNTGDFARKCFPEARSRCAAVRQRSGML
jgi:hypothetical protein